MLQAGHLIWMNFKENKMEPTEKSIWSCSVTVHFAMSEEMNAVMLSLAKKRGVKKSRIMQELIKDHHEYKRERKRMKEDGFFI